MNQIEHIMALADEYALSTASYGFKESRTAKQSIALRAAIEQALAVHPEKRPQNCGTGFCSCIECPYSDHFPDAGKMVEREWVDLPPEEIKALANLPGADRERTAVEMAYAVQAKLREKNT